jgi:alginate O-acetyltransferase complex protein AlgI
VFAIALAAVLLIYAGIKAFALVRGPRLAGAPLALYLTIWPGVRLEPFLRRRPADPAAGRLITRGALVAAAGALGWLALARTAPHLPGVLVGWLGIAVLLTTFHLGLSDVVSGALRRRGYRVVRLFADPLASRSLREFWSSRWNVAFVEMNQIIFLPALRRVFGRGAYAATFVLSGLLHELAISLPVHSGFGLPTAYFSLHALATGAERRLRVRRWPAPLARVWTWSLLILPLPLLFHRPFRDALVLPLFGGSR